MLECLDSREGAEVIYRPGDNFHTEPRTNTQTAQCTHVEMPTCHLLAPHIITCILPSAASAKACETLDLIPGTMAAAGLGSIDNTLEDLIKSIKVMQGQPRHGPGCKGREQLRTCNAKRRSTPIAACTQDQKYPSRPSPMPYFPSWNTAYVRGLCSFLLLGHSLSSDYHQIVRPPSNLLSYEHIRFQR
eukprot:scaffold67976_cov31-Tisochrysis_lutea.AAC.1